MNIKHNNLLLTKQVLSFVHVGRAKSYDEEIVLGKAMNTFWKHGYDQVTIRQLEKDMGINQFSIYSSFQNKENLFRLVLKKYKAFIESEYLVALKKDGAGLDDIRRFLLHFSNNIQTGKIPNGCLMVNTSSELSDEDTALHAIVSSYFASVKESFKKVLDQEVRKGELPSNADIEGTSQFLLGVAQSISIMAKIQTKKEIEAYVRFAMSKVR